MEGIKARAEVCWKWCFCTTQKKKYPAKNKSSSVFEFPAGVGNGVSLIAALNC